MSTEGREPQNPPTRRALAFRLLALYLFECFVPLNSNRSPTSKQSSVLIQTFVFMTNRGPSPCLPRTEPWGRLGRGEARDLVDHEEEFVDAAIARGLGGVMTARLGGGRAGQ